MLSNPIKAIFDEGVTLLTAAGVPTQNARSLIGKWRREYGDGAVMEALAACKIRGISDPVGWIVKALAAKSMRTLRDHGDAPIEATAPLL